MAGRLNPVQPAHPQQRAGHRGAGVAGAHHGAGPPVPYRFGAAHQGRVALHANRSTRVLVHFDDLAGRLDGNAGSGSRLAEAGRVPYEKYGNAQFSGGLAGAGHHLVRGPVAPHGVDRYRQTVKNMSHLGAMKAARAADLTYVDGLAALVPATVRADRVRHLGLAALGADAARGHGHRPGAGPPGARLRLGGLLLRNGHGLAILHAPACRCTRSPAAPRPGTLAEASTWLWQSAGPASLCRRHCDALRRVSRLYHSSLWTSTERSRLRPAGVDLDLLAPTVLGIAVGAAPRADPAAVGAAKGQHRQRGEQRIEDHLAQIEVVVAHLVGALVLAATSAEQLPDLGRELAVERRPSNGGTPLPIWSKPSP